MGVPRSAPLVFSDGGHGGVGGVGGVGVIGVYF